MERAQAHPSRNEPAIASQSYPRPIASAMVVTCAIVGAWLAVTIGVTTLTGGLPDALAEAMPRLANARPLSAALILFVAGTALITFTVNIVASIVAGRQAKAG